MSQRSLSITLVGALLSAIPAAAAVGEIEVREDKQRTELVLHTDEAPIFYARGDKTDGALVIDLFHTKASAKTQRSKVAALGALKRAGLANDIVVEDTKAGARVRVLLAKSMRYDAVGDEGQVKVTLTEDKLAKERVPRLAQAEGDFEDGEGAGGFGASMTYIGFQNGATQSRVFARMNQRAKSSLIREGPNIMVLKIDGASIPLRNNKNHLDTTYFASPVRMITPTEVDGDPPGIRVIIEMKEDVPFSRRREGNDIIVVFQK